MRALFLRRLALVSASVALATGALAQSPDVVVRLDFTPNYRTRSGQSPVFRWYDAMGKASTAGLSMILEPGFRVVVTERLQRIPGDGDPDQLEEYYIEDEGVWRLGKQYLPFARGVLLRESVEAARTDTNLVFEGLPISVAVCDGGNGRPRGVVGRIGTRIGISFAIGEDFGIAATSFAPVRSPESAPGLGRGYGRILGFDASRRFGPWAVSAEWLVLRGGSTAAEPNREVADILFKYTLGPKSSAGAAWSYDSAQRQTFMRFQASVHAGKGIWIEPLIKVRGTSVWEAGIGMRFRF